MKLYASILDAPFPSRREASAAAGALLRFAVRDFWNIPCPELMTLPSGKPCFAGSCGRYFSLSHSGACLLVGLSDHDIGVDIEAHREIPPRLPGRLFSSEMQRDFSFWEGWTARESIFKLTGMGNLMSMPLARRDGQVISPFEGVRCRFYDCVPGCTAAAACIEGEFCENIVFVPAADFLP